MTDEELFEIVKKTLIETDTKDWKFKSLKKENGEYNGHNFKTTFTHDSFGEYSFSIIVNRQGEITGIEYLTKAFERLEKDMKALLSSKI